MFLRLEALVVLEAVVVVTCEAIPNMSMTVLGTETTGPLDVELFVGGS